MNNMNEDKIKSPSHYQLSDGSQSIDHFPALLGKDQFEGFCLGNAYKYMTRWKGKGQVSSLKKAVQNIQFLINVEEGRGPLEDGQ